MSASRYKMYISAFGGMDGLMRVVNILRRGKVRYKNMQARFDGNNKVEVIVCLEGESKEVRWLTAKLDRLPETYSVRIEPPEEEINEEAAAATVRG